MASEVIRKTYLVGEIGLFETDGDNPALRGFSFEGTYYDHEFGENWHSYWHHEAGTTMIADSEQDTLPVSGLREAVESTKKILRSLREIIRELEEV